MKGAAGESAVTARSDAAKGRVALRSLGDFGRTAVAQRAFDEGDVILDEPPLLVIPHDLLEHSRHAAAGRVSFSALAAKHGLPPSFFDALEAALHSLTVEEFQLLAEELYSPLAHRPADTKVWLSDVLRPMQSEMDGCIEALYGDGAEARCGSKAALAIARRVFQSAVGDHAQERSAMNLLKFIHGVRVNTHSDDKAGFSGVFIAASKFAHDCCPNTFWFMKRDETGSTLSPEDDVKTRAAKLRSGVRAVHVASRRIEQGEVLTFSYVGTGWNMLTHALERRMMLRPLNFTCGCGRCKKFDSGLETCRNLHCPACIGLLMQGGKPVRLADAANLRVQPSGGGWKCAKCSATPAYDDISDVLGSERSMVDRVLATFFRSKEGDGTKDPLTYHQIKAKSALVQRVAEAYGSAHYIWVAAVCGLLRMLCVVIPRWAERVTSVSDVEMAPPLSLSDLTSMAIGASVWFEKNLKGAPQHVRFMTHVCEVSHALRAYLGARSASDGAGLALFHDEDAASVHSRSIQRLADKFAATVARFSQYADFGAVATSAR